MVCFLPFELSRWRNAASMHYQLPPKAETKLVRCIRGALLDVILDLRKGCYVITAK